MFSPRICVLQSPEQSNGNKSSSKKIWEENNRKIVIFRMILQNQKLFFPLARSPSVQQEKTPVPCLQKSIIQDLK